MTNLPQARMLLSHNFDISEDVMPPLSRQEFAKVFIDGLQDVAKCRLVDNPHWIVEVLFDADKYSSVQMGEYYANTLAKLRRNQIQNGDRQPHILILGGIKTTPPMNSSPDSLQTGEWGSKFSTSACNSSSSKFDSSTEIIISILDVVILGIAGIILNINVSIYELNIINKETARKIYTKIP